ncbi:MAG: COX15/CtaA family protein [Beijerinckiaceae bacterium]
MNVSQKIEQQPKAAELAGELAGPVPEDGTIPVPATNSPLDLSPDAAPAEPAPDAAAGTPRDRMKPVRIWLWLLALMVFAMVLVGGATRLTESGLSITEWKPVTGVIPPLSDAEWAAEFEKYKQIPQYKEMFSGMTMAQYKVIFFWEWGHRVLGRLIGVVFIVPFLFFLATGRIGWWLFWQLSGALALGAVQGGVGWWMVKSGLAGRTEVAAERLAIHLLLASLTFVLLIWIAMRLSPKRRAGAPRDMRAEATALIVVVLIQIGLGGLVAGARAGLTYNTWPLMDGHLVPPLEALTKLQPLWLNFLENPTTLQFQHRMWGYLVVLLLFGHALKAAKSAAPRGRVGHAWGLFLVSLVQVALGVLTLLWVLPAGKIPIHVALTHQGVAMVLLAMTVVHRAAMGPQAPPETSAPSHTGGKGPAEPQYAISSPPSNDTAIAT